MRETATYSHLARRARVAMLRAQIWIEGPLFQGWGCSECAWVFSPWGPPTGNSLEEMRENYERLREKEFAIHVCVERARAKSAKT